MRARILMLGISAAAVVATACGGGSTNSVAKNDGAASCLKLLDVGSQVAAQKPIAGRTIDNGLQSALDFADKATQLDPRHWQSYDSTLHQFVAELRRQSTPSQDQALQLSNDCQPYSRK